MKPSESIDAQAQNFLLNNNVPVPRNPSEAEMLETRAYMRFVLLHLDEEAERRAKFEADVIERLGRLECTTEPPPELHVGPGATRELDLTTPLYFGDGAPAVKRYEPEPEGAEET